MYVVDARPSRGHGPTALVRRASGLSTSDECFTHLHAVSSCGNVGHHLRNADTSVNGRADGLSDDIQDANKLTASLRTPVIHQP